MHSQNVKNRTHDINNDIKIAPLTRERNEKLTSKSFSPPKKYAKLLIPFLLVFALAINSMRTKQQYNPRFPDVLLIGAQKAGTSALANTLFREFDVCPAEIFKGDPDYFGKEVNFFNDPERYKQGLEFYRDRYELCDPKAVAMDSTVDYLSGPNSADIAEKVRQAYDTYGEAEKLKIIAVLREPVARELSMYNMIARAFLEGDPSDWAKEVTKEDFTSGGRTVMNFTEYVDKAAAPAIENGRSFGIYAKKLKEWFDRFDRKQILILSYDEFVKDETTFFHRVLQFLDFETNTTDATEVRTKQFNAQQHASKVITPDCVAQKRLASAFHNSNEELYALLESHPGPPMEQRPFPRFQLGNCSEGRRFVRKVRTRRVV